jgi:hypothetical protein
MTNVQSVAQVLEHIDVKRWGWRKAELVQLIATLQTGPNPVPLGRKILQALGRSDRQSRYDHELLLGLVDDRVLMRWRGEGRRPDCWAVTSVERWRGVRWTTPRREVIRLFSCPIPDAAVVLWTKTAGQASRSGPIDPLIGALAESGLSVKPWSTTPRPLDTTPRLLQGKPVDMVHNTTDDPAPSPSYLDSEFTPSLGPSEQREGGSADPRIEQGADRLLKAARAAAKTQIFGAPADRIRAVARAHPDRVEALVAFAAAQLGWVKAATTAVGLIESHAQALVESPTTIDPEARARGLRRHIATLADYCPDDQTLPGLRAELAELESQTTVPARA